MTQQSIKAKLTLLAALCALPLLFAGTARAAPDRLPANFFGISPQLERPQEDYLKMAKGGVDSVRFPIPWDAVERSRGVYDFSLIDRYVEGTARAGLEAFPAVNATPSFYGSDFRTLPSQTAEQKAAWKALLRALVDRYGPRGSFWAQNPDVPRYPIRTWQIWNEPNFFFFTEPRSPRLYAELVKISHAAIKGRDRGAKIILAGLFAHPRQKPPQAFEGTVFLNRIYNSMRGIKARFDGVALHPYADDASELRGDIRQVRRVMKRNGDARTALYITELGWGSAQGAARDTSFEKGPQGQARELTQAFNILEGMQRSARIRRVHWYAWEDLPNSCNFCDSTGLWTADAVEPKPAWFRYVRFAGCFGRTATIVGTNGHDRLIGTGGRDVILALGGNDRVIGRGGNDLICGGTGRDRISAGSGRDRVAGEQGKDRIYLQAGRDAAFGGTGTDLLAGSVGPDRLLGEGGRDRLLGAAGNDILLGGKGNDRLRGGPGRDRLLGGSGRNSLRQ